MGKVMFSVSAWSEGPPAHVFALLTDGTTWPSWTPIGSFRLERPAPGGGGGVGAIRRFRTGLMTTREEVTEVDPDRRFGYKQLSGIPISGHSASVVLEPEKGGTAITWNEDFLTRLPGMAFFLRWFVGRCASGLARAAQGEPGDPR